MKKSIGIVIADNYEYEPFLKYIEAYSYEKMTMRGNEGVCFDYKTTRIYCVKCGTGKVNSSSAASFLISDYNCDIILNIGLSGAIANVQKGDVVAGSHYVECDFDLTAVGRKLGYKPEQEYIYQADKALLSLCKECGIDIHCPLGTGDIFLADIELKRKYRQIFSICAFDMESAAIASVCHKCKIPFLSIRKISDDCEENAVESYREMNNKKELHLSEVVFSLLDKI